MENNHEKILKGKLEIYFQLFNTDKKKAFTFFESFEPGTQAAILTNLSETTFQHYLQDLSEEQVLSILKVPSQEFHMRFLQVLEPQVKKAVITELNQLNTNDLHPEEQKELEEYLLIIIGNVLTLISEYLV